MKIILQNSFKETDEFDIFTMLPLPMITGLSQREIREPFLGVALNVGTRKTTYWNSNQFCKLFFFF